MGFPLLMRMFFICVEEEHLDHDQMHARMTELESEMMALESEMRHLESDQPEMAELESAKGNAAPKCWDTESTSTTASDGPDACMLPFLAVGRVKDATVLASYVNTDLDSEGRTMETFKTLLKAAANKLSPGQRTRLQWNDGSVCCLMDSKGENLYCVVTSLLTYPERLAYQLLYDLVAQASQEPDLATAPEHGLN